MKCEKSAKCLNARGRCYLIGFSILSFFPIDRVVTAEPRLLSGGGGGEGGPCVSCLAQARFKYRKFVKFLHVNFY